VALDRDLLCVVTDLFNEHSRLSHSRAAVGTLIDGLDEERQQGDHDDGRLTHMATAGRRE
jgi:hypothetical protein